MGIQLVSDKVILLDATEHCQTSLLPLNTAANRELYLYNGVKRRCIITFVFRTMKQLQLNTETGPSVFMHTCIHDSPRRIESKIPHILRKSVNCWGAVCQWLKHSTWDRRVLGVRILLAAFRFGTLAIPFTPLCQCLSEETLNAVGPFYLVSMPGEVKYPTQRANV